MTDTRLKTLLAPISAECPCGEDLSYSAEFDRIQEARREDEQDIDYGEWQTTLKQADWNKVVSSCTALLQERSKDLRVAAWLTEGMANTLGLAGLANGIELITSLIERFGDEIHPQAGGGNHEQRIGTLSWFAGRVSQIAQGIPLTRAANGQFSLVDYDAALQLQRSAGMASEMENRVTLEKFMAAVDQTDRELYRNWIGDAERCALMLARLADTCDQEFGADGPSFAQPTGILGAIHCRLQAIADGLGIVEAESPRIEATCQHLDASVERKAVPFQDGSITTRTQALESLRQVAAFFRHTEPHSPVAYLADKAARWGAMPLHSWLRSVVKDHGTLAHIEELLGVEIEQN